MDKQKDSETFRSKCNQSATITFHEQIRSQNWNSLISNLNVNSDNGSKCKHFPKAHQLEEKIFKVYETNGQIVESLSALMGLSFSTSPTITQVQ